MGGRLTEMIDWLHTEPVDEHERRQLYCSFTITEEARAIKSAIRRQYRKEAKTQPKGEL